MPKRRKVKVDADLLRKYLDLCEEIRQDDRETERLLAKVDQLQNHLRERYGLPARSRSIAERPCA